ncbi:hypothetical protein PanWU01x14_202770 [Parasponia andersonii]|uniref:Uncharacterized protein n=1 Tax=Parasponia andersonii TaxID=3476 RepID=A0A2P5BX55_PARAD|nr:hypothetical protein PanWU01x14_202770 [Parasponia andersonii]
MKNNKLYKNGVYNGIRGVNSRSGIIVNKGLYNRVDETGSNLGLNQNQKIISSNQSAMTTTKTSLYIGGFGGKMVNLTAMTVIYLKNTVRT